MIGIFKSLRKDLVNKKLLQYGLFSEKLTPVFQSEQFGQWVRKTGINSYKERSFSCVKFRLTRNNNAPRILEIPHPIAYYRLCEEIKTNWIKIINKIGEVDDYAERSMVIPKPNNLNSRLVSMLAYNKRDDEKFLILDKSLGKKFLVHVDIANFYPSIYSHSIPWALVGHNKAKDTATNKRLWYNKLDFAIRSMQRNETVGIAIGPDTSSLIAELVLSRVDKELKKYKYLRFIDDYKCYCKSQEEADEFVRKLSKELEKYHLRLNPKKTKITQLPITLDEDWVRQLREYSSRCLRRRKFTDKDLNLLSEFIDLTIKLSKENPNDSPVRYAVKVLSNKKYVGEKSFAFIIMYLSRICFIFPYFIDVFDEILENNEEYITSDILSIIETEINSITKEHIKYSRSDVALWGLKLSMKYKFRLLEFERYSDQIINDGDCLPTLMCYKYAKQNKLKTIPKYIDLVGQLMKDKLEDDWWIYIYEVYKENYKSTKLKKIAYKDFYEGMRIADITFLNKA